MRADPAPSAARAETTAQLVSKDGPATGAQHTPKGDLPSDKRAATLRLSRGARLLCHYPMAHRAWTVVVSGDVIVERRLGSQYVLESVLGRGASGEVWRGRRDDGTPLAVKLLHQSMAEDPSLVRRFVEERGLLLGLQHPNLVRIHDFVVEGPSFAIVMELNEGSDLRKVIGSRVQMLPAEVCRLGVGIASGLTAVHAAGIVHRDIKPENVLLDTTVTPARPRLTDFGIAQITDQAPTTTSTSVVGTAQYIAPEVYEGQRPSPAVDIYGLGIVLYELSCGVTPFADSSALTVMRRHVEHAPGRPEGLPDQLWGIIAWCLAKDPSDRPQTAAQVGAALGTAELALAGAPSAPMRTSPPPSIPLAGYRAATTRSGTTAAGAATPPVRSRKKLVAAVFAALLVILGIVVTAVVVTSGSDSPGGGEVAADEDSSDSAAPEDTTTESTTATRESPLMPDVVGETVTQARSQFPSGTTVTVIEAAAPAGTPNGVIIAQDPAAGRNIPDEVTLTVATSQASTFLVDLKPVAGGIRVLDGVVLNGAPQLNVIGDYVDGCSGTTGSVQYDVGRNYTSFSAIGGIDDASEDDQTIVTVEVLGDQRSLASATVALGTTQPLEVDITGVLRLELRWTRSGAQDCGGGTEGLFVLGDARILARPGYEPPQPTE